ncbi:MAG TPA: Gfo/Idh/MocA family oxidoreductase [Candidatus Brocadiia bacterium]|nr:Gfo/Idh/MocA family oxidoreductase [Candidatus Brocadiia bacterium]
MEKTTGHNGGMTRREFVRMTGKASLASAALGFGLSSRLAGAEAAGGDTIKVGLIGCGGRGTGAVKDCVAAAKGVELVAMGDLIEAKVKGCRENLKKELPAEAMKVTDETMFWGFDNYKKVIASGVNYVILTTPPGFRPEHFRAAIEGGVNVFMEKPVAVDPVGYRSVIETGKLAAQKKLAAVAGTQKRHQAHYLEVVKRIHDGAIGDIRAAQAWYNTGGLWHIDKTPEMSDMEWQCRNWLYFTWLSGDHIVEQHVHNLDVMYWILQALPKNVNGMGGRQTRVEPHYGNIYDHFAVEFDYESGVKMASYCRQNPNCANQVCDRIIGTKGEVYLDGALGVISGENPYKYEGENWNPQVREHTDMIESIRKGQPLNDAQRIAESSLMAIAGRMSAYTGRILKWDWVANTSKLDLRPAKFEFGPLPVAPVAIPGKTELV